MNLLSVDTVMIAIGDYPLSWIEFLGTVLYFASVWLIARKHMLTWPVGIVSVILYGILFWQIRLYSDMLEQIYYLLVSLWGWASWRRAESWLWWIVVNLIGAGLYWVKDVRFIAAQYVVLLGMAVWGLRRWIRTELPGSQAKVSRT